MWGFGGEDYMSNIKKVFNGCERGGKGANRPKEDEGIGHSKLKRMGMMGKWMEVETQFGI